MAVIEALTEEECYLAAIFDDLSGVDLAELVWHDPRSKDGCFRLYDYQWSWFHTFDDHQIDQCGRSVGKTTRITLRAFYFPFRFPGEEMLITAPELVHLDPLVNLVEERFYSTRLGRFMLPGANGRVDRSAFTHKPFMGNFVNGSRILGRLPQRDGKGVKGVHPIWLELDEAQDYPHAGWVELGPTVNWVNPHAMWLAHGVSKGVQDDFWKMSQPGSGWTVHQYTMIHRPSWNDKERAQAEEIYGGRESPDYARNVWGKHGDATNAIFVLARLMQNVDDEEESEYNTLGYYEARIAHEIITARTPLEHWLDFPPEHLNRYQTFWVGMDVGVTRHPSEILVFAEYLPSAAENRQMLKDGKLIPPEGKTRLRLVTRVHLERIALPVQRKVVKMVREFYKPKMFAIDSTGVGLGLVQELHAELGEGMDGIHGYNFSEKLLVGFDEQKMAQLPPHTPAEDQVKEAGIFRYVKEAATDELRSLADNGRLWLPFDRELIREWNGQTYVIVRNALDPYGKREYSLGKFHTLDAGRVAVMAWSQNPIEQLVAEKTAQPPVYDFVGI